MCDMNSIAAGGAGITQMIGANTERQMVKGVENQKKNAQDEVIIENRKRATHDYLREVRLEQLAESQEHAALTESSNDVVKQTEATKGEARSSAAERGVAGNSLETLISDYEFQQNTEVGRLRINQKMKDLQHGEAKAGFEDQFNYRVAAEKPYVPRVPPAVDYFGIAFQALGTSAQSVSAKQNAVIAGSQKTT